MNQTDFPIIMSEVTARQLAPIEVVRGVEAFLVLSGLDTTGEDGQHSDDDVNDGHEEGDAHDDPAVSPGILPFPAPPVVPGAGAGVQGGGPEPVAADHGGGNAEEVGADDQGGHAEEVGAENQAGSPEQAGAPGEGSGPAESSSSGSSSSSSASSSASDHGAMTNKAADNPGSGFDAGSMSKSSGSSQFAGGGSSWGTNFGTGGIHLASASIALETSAFGVIGAASGVAHIVASLVRTDDGTQVDDRTINETPPAPPAIGPGISPVLPPIQAPAPGLDDRPASVEAAFDRIRAAYTVIEQMEIVQTQAVFDIAQARSMMGSAIAHIGHIAGEMIRAQTAANNAGEGVDLSHWEENISDGETHFDELKSTIARAEQAYAEAGAAIAHQKSIISAAEAEIAAWTGATPPSGAADGHGDRHDDDDGAGGSSSSTTGSGSSNTEHSGTGHGAAVDDQTGGGAGHGDRTVTVPIISRLYTGDASSALQSFSMMPDLLSPPADARSAAAVLAPESIADLPAEIGIQDIILIGSSVTASAL